MSQGPGPRPSGRLRPLTALILALVLAGLFVALSFGLAALRLGGFDAAVTAFAGSLESRPFTSFMRAVTVLGSAWVLVPLALLVAAWVWGAPRSGATGRRARLDALFLLIALAGSWVLDSLLKILFHRARPGLFPLITATGYSYPSGHAMSSMAFYLTAAYVVSAALLSRRSGMVHPVRRDSRPAFLGLAATVIILLIGFSRIYLGVHYPSDAIGGYLAGGAWAFVSIAALEKLDRGT